MSNLWRTIVALPLLTGLLVPIPAVAQEEQPEGRFRVSGEVTSVHPDAGTFELVSLRDRPWTLHVTEETEYRSPGGDAAGLEGLKPGMRIAVAGVFRSGESIALIVVAGAADDRPDLGRAAGEITSIGDRSFDLQAREGRTHTFLVTENTRFFSRDGEISGLGELAVGMRALVAYANTDHGLVALRVAVSPEMDRPSPDIRVRGEISQLGDNAITISERSGRSTSFVISAETNIRKQGGGALQLGDHAIVAGIQGDDGRNLAVWIVAASPDDRPQRDRPSRSRQPQAEPLRPAPAQDF